MKKIYFYILAFSTVLSLNAQNNKAEKTSFQTSSPWLPQINVHGDMAIVYGTNTTNGGINFENRVKSWRDKGYNVAFMTGIAWGTYFDYFLGKWDGLNHLDIGQVMQNGETISHGHNMPYIVPIQSYINYIKEGVAKRVIDADINTLFFEEPEFWAKGGYSNHFKEEWEKYYGIAWRPQDASAENTYLSNKLKYHLYYEAIKQVSDYAKQYAKSKGRKINIYIATHSLVNYSSWQIVSPEASLASLPNIDGYIAQVWTGTSREPNFFNGIQKERVFENAFLEYGSMKSMTEPTGRKMYFLTDPVEDNSNHDWADYKRNYEATFTAEILYPTIDNYEVMPWPERVYTQPYKAAGSDSAILIPKYYSTQMQVMINALNEIPLSKNKINGNNDIGVLMANSLMFQRFPIHNGYDDPQFSNFYGQTLPLLKRGIPIQIVHMENLQYANTLQSIKVLIMSYSNMKPMNEQMHQYIVDWVKNGGVLIYCGRDNDPYQSVNEWWNTKGNHFINPSQHLFNLLGIKVKHNIQNYNSGKGKIYILRQDPKEFVLNSEEDKSFIQTVKYAYGKNANGDTLHFKNNFYLERGPYDITSVMDENDNPNPYIIKGKLIDLFDPNLPVLNEKIVRPGDQSFLYDINRVLNKNKPQTLASASKIYNEIINGDSYSFVAKSPINTVNAMRILLPKKPLKILLNNKINNAIEAKSSWDENSKTLFLQFNNDPDGIKVVLSLK